MIGKKLKEEEDKKNVNEGGKTNSGSNKSSKPVNAVAKNTSKTGSFGKSSSGKYSSSASNFKMGGMDNGLAPDGMKQIDAPPARLLAVKTGSIGGGATSQDVGPAGIAMRSSQGSQESQWVQKSTKFEEDGPATPRSSEDMQTSTRNGGASLQGQ